MNLNWNSKEYKLCDKDILRSVSSTSDRSGRQVRTYRRFRPPRKVSDFHALWYWTLHAWESVALSNMPVFFISLPGRIERSRELKGKLDWGNSSRFDGDAVSRHVRSVACEPLPAFDLHFGMSRDRVNVYRRTSCWSCLWLQKQVSSPWMLNRQKCNNVSIGSVRFAKKEEENPPEEKLAFSSPSHGEGRCLMEWLACMVPTLQLCSFSILEKEYRDWSLEMIISVSSYSIMTYNKEEWCFCQIPECCHRHPSVCGMRKSPKWCSAISYYCGSSLCYTLLWLSDDLAPPFSVRVSIKIQQAQSLHTIGLLSKVRSSFTLPAPRRRCLYIAVEEKKRIIWIE